MHFFVILNPKAGNSQPDIVRQALAETVTDPHVYEIYEMSGETQLDRVVRDAVHRGIDCVVAAGGDGTVSGVADGLANTAVSLAILPTGTGNALARDLEIPLHVTAACRLLTGLQAVRKLDAIEINGRYFILRVGVGFDAAVLAATNQNQKKSIGAFAYVLNALKTLFGFPATTLHITIDGQQHHFQHVRQVVLLNAATLGATALDLEWGQDVAPDDGRVEASVITVRTPLDYLQLFWHFLSRQPQTHTRFHRLTAQKTITLASAKPLLVHGDGEIIGRTPINATVHPQAVSTIVPPAK